MFVLLCLRCQRETAASDDAAPPTRCRRCGGTFDLIDAPDEVRRRVLRTLVPLSDGMFMYGLGQASLGLLTTVLTLVKSPPVSFTTDEVFTLVGGVGVGLLGGFITFGGWMTRRGRYWQLCLVAGGLTLLSPLVAGVPLGAWGLWKLTRPEVKAAFVVR